MTTMVQPFDELTAAQRAMTGGKGGTLARLYQAGYPVPAGFVILPTAFAADRLVPAAWTQIEIHLDQMRRSDISTAFAIRSSALSEDSAWASFAGEFETILDLHRDEDIKDAIHTVRQSGRSGRVAAYSRAKGLDTTHEIAVVVQQMVRAEMSGVLFTADPITGSRLTMTGNFVYGLGDQLVSGEITGETFTIDRPKGRYAGPADLKRYARQLYKLGRRLEKELGCPQDVEWAIAGGKLHLLQSRPITTLIGYYPATGEWNDSLTGDYLWSNVNFGEAVAEVMTPLSWTVLQFILREWKMVPGYQTVGNIGGRPYLNISIFASVFQILGKSRQDLLEALAGTLYMRLPEEMEIPGLPLPRWSLLAILPNLIRLQLRQRRGLKALPAYLATNPAWCSRSRRQIQQIETKAELLTMWHQEICPHVTQSVWGVLGSVFHYADYTTRLSRKLTGLVGPDDANLLISSVHSHPQPGDSSGLLASLGPMMGLARVAHGEMDRETYLEQYGHRGPHEFELSVPRPAEDPAWLDRQLAQFSQAPMDIEGLLAKQHVQVEAAWERFQGHYPRKAKSTKGCIAEVGRRAWLREAARSEYTRDRWLVRTFGLRAGELTGLGNDIFFLTLAEVLDLLAGDSPAVAHIAARQESYDRYKALPPYPSIIRGRFDPGQWAGDPHRRSDIFDSQAPLVRSWADEGQEVLIVGAAGAAGRVEALVRCLDRPENGDQLRVGEVLVTMQTDIAWTFLFPRAAAIVTDVGAPLSHAAVVARELGIPAVVGCGDATMRLKTGDRVLVDGGRGEIHILDR